MAPANDDPDEPTGAADFSAEEVSNLTSASSSAPAPSSAPKSGSDMTPSRTQAQGKIASYMHRPLSNRTTHDINSALVELLVKNYIPFQIVESISFHRFIKLLNNSYTIPARKTVSTVLLQQMCDVIRGRVKQELEETEAVTLRTDGWTSCNNESYLSITAHYVGKDNVIKSSLLECFKYDDRHTADNLCRELKRVTSDWEIQNKIVAIVSDNAANIVAAIRLTGWRHIGPTLFCSYAKLNCAVWTFIRQTINFES